MLLGFVFVYFFKAEWELPGKQELLKCWQSEVPLQSYGTPHYV